METGTNGKADVMHRISWVVPGILTLLRNYTCLTGGKKYVTHLHVKKYGNKFPSVKHILLNS